MSSSFLLARIKALVCLFLLAVGILMAYNLQLAETNEYMGYHSFSIGLPYLISTMLAIFLIGLLMPVEIKKPSDFFTFIYGVFVLTPYVTLYPIRYLIDSQDLIVFLLALAGPFFIIRMVGFVAPPLRVPRLISMRVLVFLLILLCLVGVFFALLNAPASSGFDLETTYERRLEGRDIFPVRSPLAYLSAAIVNGFAPFLAFVAGWQRRKILLVFSLFCGCAFFYILGLKAPILLIAVASVIGYFARTGRIHKMTKIVYILLFCVFILFLLEFVFFGYSLVGDYFIRRALSVPPWVISAYFEFMSSSSSSWSLLFGVSSDQSITFIVGEDFLGFPGLNANTNSFIHQLAAGGIPMYALTILLVACVFLLLDATYECRRNPAMQYIGFSFAILLTEQAATTALVSSGIGALVICVIFSGSVSNVKNSRNYIGRSLSRSNFSKLISTEKTLGNTLC